tara:strand:- start:767 stop:2281 length:1515 start_codon:yes stop_codon:yes gene_type:complete
MKMISLASIKKIRNSYKKKNINVILAHGVFDILHVGHILYFEEAKKKNCKLVVSVTDDKFVNKGEGRPIFNINERVKILSSIASIDHIVISHNLSAVKIIKSLKPDYFIKGKDYTDKKIDLSKNLDKEIKAVKDVKGKFITSKSKLYSSSKIIGQNNSEIKSDETKEFIKKNINLEILKKKILENFSQTNNKEKVLCIGDPVVDTYNYVETLGKSAKSNILSTKNISQKSYGGGVMLVMNYLSNFIKNIDYLTYANKKNDKILKKYLNKKINIIKINSQDVDIVNKVRFIDNYSKNKLFQVNENEPSKKNLDTKISEKLKKICKKYDKILIFDFGNGFINESLVKTINSIKNKCYINCQSNSSNYGFNLASKYSSAVALSVDELEFRLSTKNKYDKIEEVIKLNKQDISKFKYFVVTQGKKGCHIVKNNKSNFIPTLIKRPADATGCGDIFFSTFLLTNIYKKFDINETGIVCHLAAGFHAKTEGNDNTINQNVFCNFAKTYLN